jgi:hypothetical protein
MRLPGVIAACRVSAARVLLSVSPCPASGEMPSRAGWAAAGAGAVPVAGGGVAGAVTGRIGPVAGVAGASAGPGCG